ncbi:hypothetical protein C8Q80DRAFT_821575 [Daedaleopsis nitida]|nr:hypothetical protein C8Q80DRAFT_821575 [Daedaleopsis nitida]
MHCWHRPCPILLHVAQPCSPAYKCVLMPSPQTSTSQPSFRSPSLRSTRPPTVDMGGPLARPILGGPAVFHNDVRYPSWSVKQVHESRPIQPGEAHLFLDIYENMMDLCGDGSYSALLAACALVCSEWLRRARINLYAHIKLTCYEDCIILLQTLRGPTAALARDTQELIIKPTSRGSSYLPYILLAPYLPSLHSLTFGTEVVLKRYPPIYCNVGMQFKQVTRVTLHNSRFRDFAELFRFVWSFPDLEELAITRWTWTDVQWTDPRAEELGRNYLATLLASLETRREPCSRLTSLCLLPGSWRISSQLFTVSAAFGDPNHLAHLSCTLRTLDEWIDSGK